MSQLETTTLLDDIENVCFCRKIERGRNRERGSRRKGKGVGEGKRRREERRERRAWRNRKTTPGKGQNYFYSLIIDNLKFHKKKNQTKQRKSKTWAYANDSQAE